jgi:hypothetical protein
MCSRVLDVACTNHRGATCPQPRVVPCSHFTGLFSLSVHMLGSRRFKPTSRPKTRSFCNPWFSLCFPIGKTGNLRLCAFGRTVQNLIPVFHSRFADGERKSRPWRPDRRSAGPVVVGGRQPPLWCSASSGGQSRYSRGCKRRAVPESQGSHEQAPRRAQQQSRCAADSAMRGTGAPGKCRPKRPGRATARRLDTPDHAMAAAAAFSTTAPCPFVRHAASPQCSSRPPTQLTQLDRSRKRVGGLARSIVGPGAKSGRSSFLHSRSGPGPSSPRRCSGSGTCAACA